VKISAYLSNKYQLAAINISISQALKLR